MLTETRYSNLCALCEHPDVCDYPDRFSGYDGALRCLAQNGGQIAWTKVYYVKKHFGVRDRQNGGFNLSWNSGCRDLCLRFPQSTAANASSLTNHVSDAVPVRTKKA